MTYSATTPIPDVLGPNGGPPMIDWSKFERSTVSEVGEIRSAEGHKKMKAILADPVEGPKFRDKISAGVHRSELAKASSRDENVILLPVGTMCTCCKMPTSSSSASTSSRSGTSAFFTT